MPHTKYPRSKCLFCTKLTARPNYKYCSNKCQAEYQYNLYIKKWKNGEITGIQSGLGIVSSHIKRFLRRKYGNKCCICGWDKENPFTKQIPLVADHIDGNWQNNQESNLRLLCPNCDALTSTYAGLNRGKGRPNRVISQRIREAHLLRVQPI